MAISETNSFGEVTDLFYNRILDQVTSVTLDNSSTVTVQDVSYAWRDKPYDQKSDFPIIVISNDDASDDEYTYEDEEIRNRLSIEVAATSTQAMTKLIGACYNAIKSYKKEFREEGVTNIVLVDKDDDSELFGGIKVRKGILVFEVTWRREKW